MHASNLNRTGREREAQIREARRAGLPLYRWTAVWAPGMEAVFGRFSALAATEAGAHRVLDAEIPGAGASLRGLHRGTAPVTGEEEVRVLEELERELKPVVGMGATVYHWSDQTAATVVEVSPSGHRIRLRADRRRPTGNGGFLYVEDPDGREYVATRRRDGVYRLKGARGAGRVVLGLREHHTDPHF